MHVPVINPIAEENAIDNSSVSNVSVVTDPGNTNAGGPFSVVVSGASTTGVTGGSGIISEAETWAENLWSQYPLWIVGGGAALVLLLLMSGGKRG